MTSQVERNRQSHARKRERGLVRVERWVHKSRVKELDKVVAKLQEEKPNTSV